MCNVFNTIGSLTTIKKALAQHNIHEFKSLHELIAFRENYAVTRQQLIVQHRRVIIEESDKLRMEIPLLQDEATKEKAGHERKARAEIEMLQRKCDAIIDMDKSYVGEILYSFVAVFLMLKIKYKDYTFKPDVPFAIQQKFEAVEAKRNRLQYISANFDEAVRESCGSALSYLERKKKVIDEINTSIYGALGEQKVMEELQKLSDDYTLINDFCLSFYRPLHYSAENQYIKTIQVDHLLISRAGVFVIETKNWSKDSINNPDLRSPVEQVKRSSYALYKILSENLKLAYHHWGEKKVPIKNVVALMNEKPPEEFQHVKVLTLRELCRYVEYFQPCLSEAETRDVVDYLRSIAVRQ